MPYGQSARACLVAAAGAALLATGMSSPTPSAAAAHISSVPESAAALERTLAAVHEAGITGAYSSVTRGDTHWSGAAGLADVGTGRLVRPGMPHRVGSVTKTFTAVAVLQLVGEGRIGLDDRVADHLPGLLPAGMGETVTLRMLLNHTSGLADYVVPAFPSLAEGSGASLDEHRFRHLTPHELVRLGLAAPPTNAPGERHAYSNTNYIVAALLLEEVTGVDAEDHITEHVIQAAGLRRTYFPATPFLPGPHARMYESLEGRIAPPRDYSVYDMSWAGAAGALVAPMEDLNRFHAALFDGELLRPAELAEMMRTVPVPEESPLRSEYGLGIHPVELSCGTAWGHDGRAWGAETYAYALPDAGRQAAIGLTLAGNRTLDQNSTPQPQPTDLALADHLDEALCGA